MPMPVQESIFVEPTKTARIATAGTPTQQPTQFYDTRDLRANSNANSNGSQQQQHIVLDNHTTSQHQQQQYHRIVQHRRMSVSTRSSTSGNILSSTTIVPKFLVRQPTTAATHGQQGLQQQQLLRNSQSTLQQQTQQMLQLGEDFISENGSNSTNSGTTGTRNVMISATTGEIFNPQYYKIVTTDGNSGNMIIDSMTPTTNNSKVLLSNLTVLSKPATSNSGNNVSTNGQQQSSSYLTTTTKPSFSYVSAANSTKQQKFTLNGGSTFGAYKAPNNLTKQLTTTTYVQQGASNQQQQQQIVQKLSVTPRLASRVNSYVPTTGNTIQQQQQATTQILLQSTPQKHVTNSRTSAQIIKKSNAKIIAAPITSSNIKNTGNILQQTQSQMQNVKTFITQQQQQQPQTTTTAMQYKTSGASKSKFIKQYNNNALTIATMSPQQQQQQQQQQQHHQNNYSKFNNQQQQQPLTTAKLTKLAGNKYVVQQHQSLQHIATLPQGTQLQQKINNSSASNLNSNYLLQPLTAGSTQNTIKFVNSHGTVIQQHQPVTTQKLLSGATTNTRQSKSYTTLTQPQKQLQQLQIVETSTNDGNNTNKLYQLSTATSQQPPQHSNQQQSLINDDVVIVNGTQMTDELSARILQSMAQKSFSNQQQRYHQQQQQQLKLTPGSTMPPPAQQQLQQHQQQQAQPSSSSQLIMQQQLGNSNILLSPQDYTLYTQQQTSTTSCLTPPIQYSNCNNTTSSTYISLNASSASSTSPNMTTSVSISSHGILPSTTIPSYMSATTARRQSISAPGSRTHSLDRRMQEMVRKSNEYLKNNNITASLISTPSLMRSSSSTSLNSLQTSTNMSLENPTPSTILNTLKSAAPVIVVSNAQPANSIANIAPSVPVSIPTDEELFIEEVRPVPVNTQDLRLQLLHAVMQDHTYAAQHQPTNQQQQAGVTASIAGNSTTNQQWSLGGIGAAVATSTGGSILQTAGNYTTFFGHQIPRHAQDDDAHSAISTGSRLALGEIDPGEETETAPEAEADDDSVTRCICDLTHDDGYMICCDKCSAWQHVDCMGIDRQNIPEEYLCEICQPRPVDKTHARTLQRQKRKEQQSQMLLLAQAAAAAATSGTTAAGTAAALGGGNLHGLQTMTQQTQQRFGIINNNFTISGDAALQALSAATGNSNNAINKRGKVHKKTKEIKKSRKGDKGPNATGTNQNGGKGVRKETKKCGKRKSKNSNESGTSGMTAAEKHAANLRQWIEHYEYAVTNHYSPELRARLHAIQKQPSLLQSIQNTENKTLRNCGDLETRALVLPFAGTKVLISSQDLAPNTPIFELRGKYMLTTQYKTQNPTINMNSPPPSNYLNSFKAHKTPGQFMFFYQLPGVEAPMQTLNADGTYPQEPQQPPPYLKGPEVCVDTRTYGNDARFVRRSCRPNAEIQHYFEKGTLHLFIVSLTQIRAQTEITIKHEPHDLQAVEQKKSNNAVVQPTSSKCACDMGNNCLFALPTSVQQQLNTVGQPKSSRSKSINPNINSAGTVQLTMGSLSNSLLPSTAAVAAAAAQKQRQANNNRDRSTSSSGESNIGLNSPNIAQMNLGFKSGITNSVVTAGSSNTSNSSVLLCNNMLNTATGTSGVLHDSGICTSSSSPSVSIPSPTPHIHSPTQLPQQQNQQQTLLTATSSGNNTLSPQRTAATTVVPQSPTQSSQISTPMIYSPQLVTSQQQPLSVIAAAAAAQIPMDTNRIIALPQPVNSQMLFSPTNNPVQRQLSYDSSQSQVQQHQLPGKPQDQQQEQPMQFSAAAQEAQMAATALQSLHDSTTSVPTTPNSDHEVKVETGPTVTTPITLTGLISSPSKSPQKSTPSPLTASLAANTTQASRKISSKHPRSLNSHSEDADENSEELTPTASAFKEKEKPKLTREDRKMEAILRAIEKMEKQDSRKKEIKHAKNATRQNSQSQSPASPSKRQNSVSEQNDSTPTSSTGTVTVRKNTQSTRKKKRKASRSYSLSSNGSGAMQRKRRKSIMVNNESDDESHAVTSESETTSVLSSPIQAISGTQNCLRSISPNSIIAANTNSAATNADQAAGLLLSLASQTNVEPSTTIMSSATSTSPFTSPAPVSSACLLIEAAMGPLAQLDSNINNTGFDTTNQQEFKYPGNTKTKKTMMSNWFNQTDTSNQQIQPASGLDSLVQAAMCDIKEQQTREQDEQPQNLSMAALKIEEFIHQTEIGSAGNVTTQEAYSPVNHVYQHHSEITTARHHLNLPIMLNNPANNSSVKKRWLRQAISEETDSDAVTPSSASKINVPLSPFLTTAHTASSISSSVPPEFANSVSNVQNGFTTPLKKRRLIMNNDSSNNNVVEEVIDEPTASTTSVDMSRPLLPPTSTPTVINKVYEESTEVTIDIKSEPNNEIVNKAFDEDQNRNGNAVVGKNVNQAADDTAFVDVGDQKDIKTEVINVKEEASSEHKLSNLMPLKLDLKYNDQEDDEVDVLRSPSPGGKIVVEDNLVKIEPEDTSGAADDIKIDVECEESQAGNKFDEILISKRKEEIVIIDTDIKQEQNQNISVLKHEEASLVVAESMIEIKPMVVLNDKNVEISQNQEKLPLVSTTIEKTEKTLHKNDKVAVPKLENKISNLNVKTEIQQKHKFAPNTPKQEIQTEPKPGESLLRNSKNNLKTESTEKKSRHDFKTDADEPVKKKIKCEISVSANIRPSIKVERKSSERKNLTEHDIHERLLSFHAENISYLQSRNKKSKSNGTSANPNAIADMVNFISVAKPLKSKKEHKTSEKRDKHKQHNHNHSLTTSVSVNSSMSPSNNSSVTSKKEHKKKRTKSASDKPDKNDKNADKATASSSSINSSSKSTKTNKSAIMASTSMPNGKPGYISSSIISNNNNSCSSSSSNTNSSKTYENNTLRRRTMSMCAPGPHHNNSLTTTSLVPPKSTAMNVTLPSPISHKKRQTNFEQELAKSNLQIAGNNNSSASNSKHHQHRKENRHDESAAALAKLAKITRRRESMCSSKYQVHAITAALKKEKREKKKSKKSSSSSSKPLNGSTSSNSAGETAYNNVVQQLHQNQHKLSTPQVLHPTIPHFNNIVASPSLITHQQVTIPPIKAQTTNYNTQVLAQPVPQSTTIPSRGKAQELSGAAPIPVVITQPVLGPLPPVVPNNNVLQSQVPTHKLPYYNTIYGKLHDSRNSVPKLSSAPSLSEFLDASKSRSYSTLGGYSSTLLAPKRLNNGVIEISAKETTVNTPSKTADCSNVISIASTTLTNNVNSIADMPPPTTPLKVYTRTASHDPRLNPMLSVPEPPSLPKRKLSISEYRMRQKPNNTDIPSKKENGAPATYLKKSPSSSSTLATSSTTSASTSITINKCSLQSPERYSVSLQRRNSISVHGNNQNISNGGEKSTAASTLIAVNSLLNKAHSLNMFEDKPKGGQFNAAPTQLERQQERMCEFSRCLQRTISCDSRVILSKQKELARRLEEETYRNHRSASQKTIDFDNSLEAISSSSTSLTSSRESSPEGININKNNKKQSIEILQQKSATNGRTEKKATSDDTTILQ